MAVMAVMYSPGVLSDSTYRTPLFRTEVTVNADGSIQVTETIVEEFNANRHGIERYIPFVTHDQSVGRRLWPISDITVATDTATPNRTETSIVGDYIHIRIGDPNQTITGLHTYQIAYRVDAAVTEENGELKLAWDAFETWRDPVDRAELIVIASVPASTSKCHHDSTECSSLTVKGARVTAVEEDLGPYEAFTVEASWPKGSFGGAKVLKEGDAVSAQTAEVSVLPASAAVAVAEHSSVPYKQALLGAGALSVYIVGGFRERRRWRRQSGFSSAALDATFSTDGKAQPQQYKTLHGTMDDVAPVDFIPPWGLKPAELGVLVDVKDRNSLLVATVVDLAARGELELNLVQNQPSDWEIRRVTTGRVLSPFEQTVLDIVLQGAPVVRTTALQKRETVQKESKKLQSAIEDQLVTRGLLKAGKRQRVASGGFNVVATLLCMALLGQLPGLLLAFAVLSLTLFAPSRGCRNKDRTELGNAVAWRCGGFEKFLEESENYHAAIAADTGMKRRYMGFAVVTGAVAKWTSAFQAAPGAQMDPWVTSGFANQVSSFSNSLSNAVSPSGVYSRSGGRGGGRGGGGGGGGGW